MPKQAATESHRNPSPGPSRGLVLLLVTIFGVGGGISCAGCAKAADPVVEHGAPTATGPGAANGTGANGTAANESAGGGVAEPVQPQAPQPAVGPAPVHGYRVLAEFTHDFRSFTQGLVFAEGQLYESAGKYAASDLRRVDLVTGEVLERRRLAGNYFAEGLAAVGERLIQLTWQNGKAFVYDRTTFEKIGEFPLAGEGWGLTYDGERLILSDGTEYLRFLDPETFAQLGTVRVTDDGRPIQRINELEFVRGEVWANIWQTNRIARIDPQTGRVNSWVDLTGIIDVNPVLVGGEPQNVLNGIAFEPITQQLYVTGKNWPKLFQIEVVE
ncbi:glutaminyl-peptide cyclotransferase [Engelhardtia mirabilis]|uniref:Glutamine cyclotransferase n=1 Tax=Engelhardtia mirabilis TaxID=2528011 RepID=A0A518BGA4_9BACT|nr:Glutamine cyclotransferase [Planctomycetes bacterium Pla133]QDV00336.1 Glutamine cyclotransferase [Planctomycetes bacterium Pla86]